MYYESEMKTMMMCSSSVIVLSSWARSGVMMIASPFRRRECTRPVGVVVDRNRRPRPGAVMFMLRANMLLLLLFAVVAQTKSEEMTGEKTDAHRHKIRGLDRIMNRLDGGNTPAKSQPPPPSQTWTSPTGAKDDLRRHFDPYLVAERRAGAGEHHSRPHASQTTTPSPSVHKGNLDEDEYDLDPEEDQGVDPDDDDESFEDDNDEDGDLLNDNMSNWSNKYRERYYAMRGRQLTSTTTTTTTTTTTPAPPQPSFSYTDWKWRNLGSRQALEQTRREMTHQGTNENSRRHHGHDNHHRSHSHHQQGTGGGSTPQVHARSNRTPESSYPPSTRSSATEAVQHAMRVRKDGDCSTPRPRLVKVQDHYPHPSKQYVPHCTILHQCSDETGCCRQDFLTCGPKITQRVELPFYTYFMDQTRPALVERLTFYNHTECECRDKRDEMMPRDAPDPSLPESSSHVSHHHHHRPKNTQRSNSRHSKRGTKQDLSSREKETNNFLPCRCPSAFARRTLQDGSCSCDCFDQDKICLGLKRGRDFFPLHDKWCIQSGRCEVPECSYGPYIHLIGRCPRKLERSGQNVSWTKYLTTP